MAQTVVASAAQGPHWRAAAHSRSRDGASTRAARTVSPCRCAQPAPPARAATQAGVALASAGELSFNWTGFLTAMASNLTFGFRAVWSKR